jgi:hypothetical protein
MTQINIKATDKTPSIEGNTSDGTLKISGKSLPENPREFYKPFSEWLNDFFETPADKVEVILDIEYFNTSTSNLLVELLRGMAELSKSKDVKVIWRFEEDDLDMEDVGNDFKLMVGDIVHLEPKKPA